MKRIRVRLGARSYEILIGNGLIRRCGPILKKLDIGRDAVVITNAFLAGLYRKDLARTLAMSGFTSHFELVPDSERAKSIGVATALLQRLSAYDVRRKIFIIALGGGVVGDLAGFIASIYKRGIPYIQIPTTLLAQVDSSIGGKVAIDLPVAKNLVGSFYQPRIVISDTAAVRTLSARQMRNGLAEIIKYGVIKDPVLFRYLEKNHAKILRGNAPALEFVITRCAAIKAAITSRDECDRTGVRASLNYGHTIGHAIEAAGGYSGRYNHGEAVALGILVAGEIAVGMKRLKTSDAARIAALVKASGLPTSITAISPVKIYAAHLHDKKFVHGRNRFILASRIGAVRPVEGIPDSVIRAALDRFIG